MRVLLCVEMVWLFFRTYLYAHVLKISYPCFFLKALFCQKEKRQSAVLGMGRFRKRSSKRNPSATPS